MPQFVLSDQSNAATSDAVTITTSHFGTNLVTVYDQEFGDPTSGMADLVDDMDISTLRFPGGSATELFFDMRTPNSTSPTFAPGETSKHGETLLPMDTFFASAGTVGADVALVIPTRVGFAESAGEAALNGTYGARTELDSTYISDILAYVGQAIDLAIANGVQISALEIGNEFWGSGQMTGGEYGTLAGKVSAALETYLTQRGYTGPEIVVQTTSAASELYSPYYDTTAYVEMIDGEAVLRTQSYVKSLFGGSAPDGWQKVTIPGQRHAKSQVADILDGINATQGAGDAIDGVAQHFYEGGGFAKVDEGHEYWQARFADFDTGLNRSANAPELTRHITEWDTRANRSVEDPDNPGQKIQDPNAHNRGLQHSAMMLEILYELATAGVDSAQYWPLSFNRTQSVTLLSSSGNHMTQAGEMFRLMEQSLVGKTPILDYSVANVIDIHGFSGDGQFTFFASERSGTTQSDITLSFGSLVGSGTFFASTTSLWDGGAGGNDHTATPELTSWGTMMTGSDFATALRAWEIQRISLTPVDDFANTVVGSNGNDSIDGLGGNDTIKGGDGDDSLVGGSGGDSLVGGAGNDTLKGGDGRDMLFAQDGNDLVEGGEGNDAVGGGSGNDTVKGGNGNDTAFGGEGNDLVQGGDGDDDLWAGNGSDTVEGGLGDDRLAGGAAGDDVLFGGNGDDQVFGGVDNDTVNGGDGNDTLWGGGGRDLLDGGAGDDVLRGVDGDDTFVFSAGHDRIIGFVAGGNEDKIDISAVSSITDNNDLRTNHLVYVDGNAAIDDGMGNVLILEGVSISNLTNNDFLF